MFTRVTHTCNSYCGENAHADLIYVETSMSCETLERTLAVVLNREDYRVRVVREVAEYTIPEGLRWLGGTHPGVLVADYPPVQVFLVEYTTRELSAFRNTAERVLEYVTL